jgi:hypothetical protein
LAGESRENIIEIYHLTEIYDLSVSRTGTTQKYDGPYSVISLLRRQHGVAIMPVIGDTRQTQVNVVPRDFVLDAITYLSGQPDSKNQVYQLADPNALTVGEMLDAGAGDATKSVARTRAARDGQVVPGARTGHAVADRHSAKRFGLFPASGALRNGQNPGGAGARGGIRCPRSSEYVEPMVGFVRAHPEIGSAAMA